MWELYGLWTWFLSLYTEYLEDEDGAGFGGEKTEFARKRLASIVTFGVVGSGATSCVFVGWIGEKRLSRCLLEYCVFMDRRPWALRKYLYT